MEWYAGLWCLTVEELTRDDRTPAMPSDILAPILSYEACKSQMRRGKIQVVRRGGGASCPALIDYASLPDGVKAKVRAKHPDIEARQAREKNPTYKLFQEAYQRDLKALSYYIYKLQSLNQSLTEDRLMQLASEYSTNASVIQAVVKLRRDNELYRKVRGRRGVSWQGNRIKF